MHELKKNNKKKRNGGLYHKGIFVTKIFFFQIIVE